MKKDITEKNHQSNGILCLLDKPDDSKCEQPYDEPREWSMGPIIVMQSLSIVRQIEVQYVDIGKDASYQANKKYLVV